MKTEQNDYLVLYGNQHLKLATPHGYTTADTVRFVVSC